MLKIISEIGINHNGNFNLIEELIRQSSIGKADFAKFQLYDSKRVFGDDSRKRNEFTYKQVCYIKEICDCYNIEFFASVFDEEKLQWCQDLGVSFYKVASRTVVKEPELMKKIVSLGKTTFVSLGQWKNEELPLKEKNVKYFNCISKYPTSILDIRNSVERNYDQEVVGISDHSFGIANCLLNICNGAQYVEKHFTLNKGMDGNDHVGSMNLDELMQLRELGNQLFLLRKK